MTDFFKETFNSTYKDDYSDSDNYYRILFNAGRALQARELTQSQTIINKEMERFGRNIFKEGAIVNPGGVIISNFDFVKLASAPTNGPAFEGQTLTGGNDGVQAVVINYIAPSGSDPATLFVKYTDTSGGTSGTSPITFAPSESLTDGAETLTVQTTNTTANPAVGTATKVSNGAGDIFVAGHFVFVPAQTIVLSKYTRNPSAVVGFVITQDIVTEEDNTALYDNQGDVPNVTAPGGHRYRIRCTLTDQANVDSDKQFIMFARIVDGNVVEESTGINDYNKINDVLAVRTKEESGDYVVKPFRIAFDEDSDAGYLQIDVSPGTAYVNGYRADVQSKKTLRIPRPTDTTTRYNDVIPIKFGNYVEFSEQHGLPDLDTFELLNLYTDSNASGPTLGTARVKSIDQVGSNYRVYLFNVQVDAGQNIRNVKSIGEDSNTYFNIIREGGQTSIKEANTKSLLFPLPLERPSSIVDMDFFVQESFLTATNGSGQAVITTSDTFTNTNDWILAQANSDIDDTINISLSGDLKTATITNGPPTTIVDIYAYVNKNPGTARAKTLTLGEQTRTMDSDGAGLYYFDLRRADVFNIVGVWSGTDSTGEDLSSRFILDDGQREDRYDVGRLILKSGQTKPSGSVYAKYNYFTHGAGDYFSVNSYSSIDYDQIPTLRMNDGTVINLEDYVDFRSVKDSTGLGFDIVNPLPQNGQTLDINEIDYYNGRKDKLVITENGTLSVVQGSPALISEYPLTPNRSMELYRIDLNPNTLSTSDLDIQPIEYRHYTMSDIDDINTRLNKLEEATALSLLENETNTIIFFDAAGNARTKSGFFVDNFSDHSLSATYADDYRAAIDPTQQLVRPSFSEKNVRLIYDSAASTGTVRRGDFVYPTLYDRDGSYIIEQLETTGVENVNPFNVINYTGWMELSPAGDEWRDVINRPDEVRPGSTTIIPDNDARWRNWTWDWAGLIPQFERRSVGSRVTDIENAQANLRAGRNTWSSGLTSGPSRVTHTISSKSVIRERVGERIVELQTIPFIRSRMVYFKAEGLRPNTQHFAFFDGTSVASWVRSEATFIRYSDDDGITDYGNNNKSISAHPEGVTTLVSDGFGRINGSFWIPNTSSIRFRSGDREFKLLDITANLPSATSNASANYRARGTTVEKTAIYETTRTIQVRSSFIRNAGYTDPLAQTFYVPNKEGVFVQSIDLFFQTEDTSAPVTVQIRPVVNGVPSSDIILPGSIKTLNPSQVNVSIGSTYEDILNNATNFEFDELVYLTGETWYSIVVLANSTDYNLYVNTSGDFRFGSTTERSNNAYAGSLFKSQNGLTWTPSQKQDLMFRVKVAEFYNSYLNTQAGTQGAIAVFSNATLPKHELDNNPLSFDSGSSTVTVNHPNSGLEVGDIIDITGLDSATAYAGVLGSSLMGAKPVVAVDNTGYTFVADSSATSSGNSGGTGVLVQQKYMYDAMYLQLATLVPEGARMDTFAKFTTGTSLAGDNATASGTLQSNVKDGNWSPIPIGQTIEFEIPQMIGNTYSEGVLGSKSLDVKVDMYSDLATEFPGGEYPEMYVVAPVIDLQRSSMILVNNDIDKQDSAATNGYNVPLTFVNETSPNEGSSRAKHITSPITLVQDAVGINVIFDANRPSTAEILVYYRVSAQGEDLDTKDWTLATINGTLPTSDEVRDVFREYSYLIGGTEGTLDPFTQFQLKIVMNSTNTCKVPVIKSLRAIAMAV